MNANKLPIIQSANFWIILAVIAFLLLPSHALDYGLFESTSDEYLGAMGLVFVKYYGIMVFIGYFIRFDATS